MPEPKLRMYPSGFLGSAEVKSSEQIGTERYTARLLSTSTIINENIHVASMEVSDIWACVTNASAEVGTFEFHERVLRHALKVFGREQLYLWIQAQKKSPQYGEYMSRWIDETLEYVFRGVPRAFSVYNWTALLAAAGDSVNTRDSKVVQDIFFNIERMGEGYSVASFIAAWLQQTGGFEDLTGSLYVLFGPR